MVNGSAYMRVGSLCCVRAFTYLANVVVKTLQQKVRAVTRLSSAGCLSQKQDLFQISTLLCQKQNSTGSATPAVCHRSLLRLQHYRAHPPYDHFTTSTRHTTNRKPEDSISSTLPYL